MKVGHRPSTGAGAHCRSCRAPIVWAFTDTGRKMPVDREPVPMTGLLAEVRDGNLVLWYAVDGQGRAIGAQNVSHATEEQRRDPSVPLWKSHFVTCPKAATHRRRDHEGR